jgi:HPt (histidine-containing phosphotransfer) domain-containing protein
MFLEKGLNDYLSKPINVAKMDDCLARWIPKEKQRPGNAEFSDGEFSALEAAVEQAGIPTDGAEFQTEHLDAFDLPGVDAAKGIVLCGGTEELYRQVLAIFRKDAEDRLPFLKDFAASDGMPEALARFTTQAHALKSALASIGAADISALAALLEAAGKGVLQGKAGDLASIREKLPGFTARLEELVVAIGAALSGGAKGDAAPSDDARPRIMRLLQELAAALEKKNVEDIDRLLEELNQQNLDVPMREMADALSDSVLMADFDAALEHIEKVLEVYE